MRKERKDEPYEKLKDLSRKEFEALMDIVSFIFAVYPLFNAFEQFKSYLHMEGGTPEDMFEWDNLMRDIQRKLYKKIKSRGLWKYLKCYSSTRFKDCLSDLITAVPPKGISASKITDILFTGTGS